MSAVSKAEGQRKLSLILSDKRKKDPVGLLRAQRNGTLNEYLREDLAKHGLAVASSTGGIAGTSASASAPAKGPATTSTPSATSAPTLAQRHSYKLPSSASNASASVPVSPPPPPVAASSSSPPPSRAAPGKLSASRFGSFGASSVAAQQQQQQEKSPSRVSREGLGVVGAGSASSTAGRWVVGPTSSLSSSKKKDGSGNQETVLAEKERGEETEKGQETQTSASGASSVGGLAERFGGVKLGTSGSGSGKFCTKEEASSGPEAVGASAAGGGISVGGRSGSGRIAELARRFEK